MRRTTAAFLGVTSVSAGIIALRRRRPRRLRSRAISSPVTIARDRYGVPVITAASREDALFGLGYVLADDRLFQMDTLRRSALGRLSELAGPVTLDNDRMMRLLGVEQIARRMVEVANPTATAGLVAFAAGVNHRMASGPLPVEFRVLRYRPEPWRPEDSAAIVRLMGWTLSAFHTSDMTAALVRETIGDAWADAIFNGTSPDSPLVVREFAQPLDRRATAAPVGLPLPPGGMSNAWAVSGDRSTTGFPLLANDPHLGYTNPSIWCEATVDAPGLRVSGLTLPGVPGLAFGRTPNFAWGFTAAMIAQTFVYRERLNDNGRQIASADAWVDLETRTERIGVKGQPDEQFVIRITPRGPLVSDLHPGYSKDPISLYWTGSETHPDELDAWMTLNSSTSIDDAILAREAIIAPTLNMAASDGAGGIATISVGRWSDRPQGPGLLDPSEFPPRYIPPAELPVERNPERGWIASANNTIVNETYPYRLHGFYEPDYRIRRITELLESRTKHSVADMRSIQLDQFSLHASELTGHLLELTGDVMPEWARSDLQSWDFQTPLESRATLLFQAFYREWVRCALAHRLPVSVVDRLLAGLDVGNVPMGFCDRLLRGEIADWWKEDERSSVARDAFQRALSWIEACLGPDPATWTWGAVHSVTWSHPFGQINGPHQSFVNVGPFPLGGDRTTVWPTGYDAKNLFSVTAGPSMRLLADLRRPERTWVTNTLGQHGTPLRRHYRDQVQDFIEGRSHPIWGQNATTRVIVEPEHH